LHRSNAIYQYLVGLILPLILIIGVNIHSLLNSFNHLTNAFIKSCSSYYDPIRNTIISYNNGGSGESSKTNINQKSAYKKNSREN
jgi:hypothetical protein